MTRITAWRAFADAASALIGGLASAVLWFVLAFLSGVSAVVCGVYLLAGTGWALIAVGLISIASALLILRGMSRG